MDGTEGRLCKTSFKTLKKKTETFYSTLTKKHEVNTREAPHISSHGNHVIAQKFNEFFVNIIPK